MFYYLAMSLNIYFDFTIHDAMSSKFAAWTNDWKYFFANYDLRFLHAFHELLQKIHYFTDSKSVFHIDFESGIEDIEVDITTLAEQWINSPGNLAEIVGYDRVVQGEVLVCGVDPLGIVDDGHVCQDDAT